jgi:prespore-specific regulator
MAKTKTVERHDGWTDHEDLTLVDIVLRHIRTGKTMTQAFEEAEKTIGRTAGACKFRWTTILSKKYDASVEQAKFQRLAHSEKAFNNLLNGGETMTFEMMLPKNRPSTPIADAMEKALNQSKEKRSEKSHVAAEPEKKNETGETKEEKAMDNPFVRIRKFVVKMEREYGNLYEENRQLKHQLEEIQAQLTAFSQEKQELEQQLANARKELATYAEIKELIKQFNEINP